MGLQLLLQFDPIGLIAQLLLAQERSLHDPRDENQHEATLTSCKNGME
jgi:hypothetical protein